jgi:hypothetical protein
LSAAIYDGEQLVVSRWTPVDLQFQGYGVLAEGTTTITGNVVSGNQIGILTGPATGVLSSTNLGISLVIFRCVPMLRSKRKPGPSFFEASSVKR